MQKIFLICSLFSFLNTTAQNVGIGTNTPAASAKLDVTSTNSGLLPPRMTYAQRNAIVNPVAGLIIYCTDCANGEMQYYNGTTWMQMTVAVGSVPFVVPTITTTSVSAITTSTATSGGNITSDGGVSVTARGVVWDTLPLPTIALSTKTNAGSGTGSYTSNLTGLLSNKTYHVRAYATNNVGTAYGGDLTFSTLTPPPYSYTTGPNVTDVNGNLYPSIVTSCGQTWTTKNLNVSRYKDGSLIPQVTNAVTWAALTTGAWCWYNNDSATYAATYGKLYNWYAVNDTRGIAPQGWHVPIDAEWNKFTKCLDPAADTNIISATSSQSAIAGGAMKELGTSHWVIPNTGANNNSGFLGLPGGNCTSNGAFDVFRTQGIWWSNTQNIQQIASARILSYNNSGIFKYNYYQTCGFSVRLVKD